MSLAWEILKSPMRGTQGLYFDQSQQAGAFPSRFGVSGPEGTVHGVWAAGTDDPITPFQYAMGRGNLGPGHQPMVHTMPQQGAIMQQPGSGYTPALRFDRSDFPQGVPTQNVETVWRGPSYETYMDHPSVRPDQKNTQGYKERMMRDYTRSLAQFHQNRGTLPYETQPEYIAYPNQDPSESWRTISHSTPGEEGKWMRQQVRGDRPFRDESEQFNFERGRSSGREAVLAPTLTGNEVPYYKRERSNIPSIFSTPEDVDEKQAFRETWEGRPWENMVFPDQAHPETVTSLFGRSRVVQPKNTGWDDFDFGDVLDEPTNTGWVNPENGRMVGVA